MNDFGSEFTNDYNELEQAELCNIDTMNFNYDDNGENAE